MFAGISGLDLAIGIKEMLVNNGFTSLDALLKMPPAELALILGIDLYVARLIYLAAKRQAKIDKELYALNDEAFIRLEQSSNNNNSIGKFQKEKEGNDDSNKDIAAAALSAKQVFRF